MVFWVDWLRPGLPRLLPPDGAGQQGKYGMKASGVGLGVGDLLWRLVLGGGDVAFPPPSPALSLCHLSRCAGENEGSHVWAEGARCADTSAQALASASG